MFLIITFIPLQLLRDQFDYKPILTKKQFIQSGFAEWKIEIVCDILNCVMKKHKELIGLDKVILQIDWVLTDEKKNPVFKSNQQQII